MEQSDRAASTEGVKFSAILLPHRSLGRKGFIILMAAIGAVNFAAGLLFFLIGAWPVVGFMGLDVLLIYIAFRLNYRSGRLAERIELTEKELKLTRIHPSGRAESWSFNPYWVRLDLEERPAQADVLYLRSHGQRLVFASFLTDYEKKEFAQALRKALHAARGPRV